MRVTVYAKPGCHLCEDALVALERLTPQYGLEVEEVNILDNMALYDAYHEKIPVVKIEDGRLGTLEAPIDEASLRATFEIARRAYPAGTSVLDQPTREPWIDRVVSYIGHRWLRFANVVLGLFVGVAWLAPVFARLGWWNLANPIYTAYALTCHQLPERAGSIFGYQVAFCYRNTALYGGAALFGILYALARDDKAGWLAWLKTPIPWWAFVILLLPMAVDGTTHLLGVRDNMMDSMDASFGSFFIGSQVFSLNWWLRVITGLIAALGVVWFAYPRMERSLQQSENMRLIYEQSASAL